MTEGIILIDADGNIAVCNPPAKQFFNLGASEELTKKIFEAGLKRMELDDIFDSISLLREEFASKNISLTGPEEIKVHCNISSLKDEKGLYKGTLLVLRNTSKEEELEKLKRDFIATVSHELRTPLTAMGEFVSIMLDEISGKINKEQKEYLNIIKENVDRLSRIINRLLELTRIESRKIELKRSFVNIGDLVNNVINVLKRKADTKHILLRTNFSEVMPNLYIDSDMITQVLTNIIDNSIKFTDFWGKITVNISNATDEVKITISDTGIGIPLENLKEIFDRFRQVGRTDSAGAKGVGLGLAISKEFVEMHQGKIWAESEIGKGSSFIFTLPKFNEEVLFKEYLVDAISFVKNEHRPLSLLVAEIDNFWDIESKYGIEAAQHILKDIEETFKETLRGASDKITRYKRSTVASLLMDADKGAALAVEKRLRDNINNTQFDWKKNSPAPEFSFRTATYPEDGTTARELIIKAERI